MADQSSAPDATAQVAASASTSPAAFQRVIVPLDGSEIAEKALAYGQEIARRFSATLVLLRAFEGAEQSTRMWATMPADPVSGAVDPNTYQLIEEGAAAAKQSARAYLDEKAKALNDAGIAVDTVMVDDAPADAIIAEATHGSGPLVVMCTHGRGGISRLVFGSTAQDVLKRIKTSLLLVRVYEDADITREGAAMDIRIGADVVGTEGKLGVVDKVVVDA